MQFLVSKVVTLMMVKFFRVTTPKVVCILFQALKALAVEYFPYKLVFNEGLNNLPERRQLCYSCVYQNKV